MCSAIILQERSTVRLLKPLLVRGHRPQHPAMKPINIPHNIAFNMMLVIAH
jgi:hypothetical protein